MRDRAANGLTLFSQSSAASDVDLTRRIRRALVQDKYLSTSANNITIIAKDGSVTLRAPVRMQHEQTIMARNDRQVAGADRADDQLDILPR